MAIRRAALACGVTLLVAHVGAFVPTTARAAFTAPSTGAYVPCRGVSGALRLRASAPRNADESKDGVFNQALTRRKAINAALSGAALLGLAPDAFAQADQEAAKIKARDAKNVEPGKDRNNIKVPKAVEKLQTPEIVFPKTTADLEAYTQTPSGLYFQELVVGEGPTPKKGKVLEMHYVGTVCSADPDGSYECALKTGPADIYPSLPQGILKDSPSYDSSFDRGRTMKVRFGGAQLSKGLEEALSTMKPGGVKMVFLTPDLSFACPKGRQCVADIEIDQRLVFYLELISVGEQQDVGG